MTQSGSILLGVFLLLGGILITMMTWLIKTVITHNSALALLLREVNPPNGKSLRDMINDLQTIVARNDRQYRGQR